MNEEVKKLMAKTGMSMMEAIARVAQINQGDGNSDGDGDKAKPSVPAPPAPQPETNETQ